MSDHFRRGSFIDIYRDPVRGLSHRCILCVRRRWQETGEVLLDNGFTPANVPIVHLPRCPADPYHAGRYDSTVAAD